MCILPQLEKQEVGKINNTLLLCYRGLRDSHSAVPFMVDRVTMTSRSRAPVCTDSVTVTLPVSSLTE